MMEKVNVSHSSKVVINGKEYSSLDGVPEEFKKLLEDKDGNNIPDIADSLLNNGNMMKIASSAVGSFFNVWAIISGILFVLLIGSWVFFLYYSGLLTELVSAL